jgi:hypothetical protein
MKIRLNNGITYQTRANIFPPVKKTPKKIKFLEGTQKSNSVYQQIHDHFIKYDLLQLNEFGEDIENYGNLIIKGINYPPKRINMDFILKKMKEEDKAQNNLNLRHNQSIENIKVHSLSTSNRKSKIMKKRQLFNPGPEDKLPYLELKRNQNKSNQNLNINKFKKISKNIKNNEKLERSNSNNIYITKINNNKSYDDNQSTQSYKKQSDISSEKTKILPILNNKIKVTDRIYKLIFQNKKIEAKTNKNKDNLLLKKIIFLKRYDSTTQLKKKLNELSNDVKRVNGHIYKSIDRNDDDKPQFNLRFNYLLSQFKD